MSNPCGHQRAVPVTLSTGEEVGALCEDCFAAVPALLLHMRDMRKQAQALAMLREQIEALS